MGQGKGMNRTGQGWGGGGDRVDGAEARGPK